MLIFLTRAKSRVAINPLQVLSVSPDIAGSRIEFNEGRFVLVDVSFEDVVRQLAGALKTREVNT